MASSRKQKGEKHESALEVIGGIFIAIAILTTLIWFLSSHKIVYYTSPALWYMGTPWAMINADKWQQISDAYVFFREHPQQIKLSNYLAYANACLKPMAFFISLLSAAYIGSLFFFKGGRVSIRRKMSPMEAAKEISQVFHAIIPVLHLGPKLVKNELPLWRRQTFPEDIWMHEKIDRRPMVEKNILNLDRATVYFRGGEKVNGEHKLRGGRRWSKMLGYQVVDLLEDAPKYQSLCFPDRFSSQGKVLFALLCAHAFGEREGKKDYQEATKALNCSCAGQANGLPNLSVAQWIYDKYRANPMAKKLFSVHHWEYSYLFTLFIKAKLTGKATHTDFIWLKPQDRILFYVLNTVGRSTPPVEASAVFSQVDYEVRTAKAGRLPLVMRPDGRFEANIAVGTSVEGLNTEFTRYQQCYDDSDDWWKELKTWTASNEKYKQIQDDAVQREMAIAAQSVRQAVSLAQQREGKADMNEYELTTIKKAQNREDAMHSKELQAIAEEVGLSRGTGTESGNE